MIDRRTAAYDVGTGAAASLIFIRIPSSERPDGSDVTVTSSGGPASIRDRPTNRSLIVVARRSLVKHGPNPDPSLPAGRCFGPVCRDQTPVSHHVHRLMQFPHSVTCPAPCAGAEDNSRACRPPECRGRRLQ